MSNVVEFPLGKISNPHADKLDVPDHEREVANRIMRAVVMELAEYQYNAADPELFRDLAVIMNFMYAALRRTDDMEHFLHQDMEELGEMFLEMKKVENDPT
jgi:hypothetical protein